MGFLNQPQIVAAIIALVGAALIVPLVKKFYFDVQHTLRVEVRAFSARTSEVVQKIVIGTLPSPFDPLAKLVRSRGYLMVKITNSGKRKINGVSATLSNSLFEMQCQLDDDVELIAAKTGTKIDLGDIQPKHSRMIHMWSDLDTSDWSFGGLVGLKHILQLSADELDNVRIRFPMSRYMRKKYEFRLQIAISMLCTALFITAMYVSFHLGYSGRHPGD